MELVHNTMVIISNSATVYAIKPELFWIIIAPLPIISLMQKAFIKKMEKMHERGRRVAEHVVANTNEMVRELRTVRSFAMEAEEADNYTVNSQYKTDIDEWASVVHLVFFISPLITMFLSMRFFAIATAGTFVVSVRAISVGMAIQTRNCADHLQHCVRGMLDMIPNIVKVRGPVGRVCDALNAKPTIEPYAGMPPKLKVPIKGRIDFVDVNFTFPSEPTKQILHGLTFWRPPGEKVAFVGATGCGKSTAIQLVQRFCTRPRRGRPPRFASDRRLRCALPATADLGRRPRQCALFDDNPQRTSPTGYQRKSARRPDDGGRRGHLPSRRTRSTLSTPSQVSSRRIAASAASSSLAVRSSGWPLRARLSETPRSFCSTRRPRHSTASPKRSFRRRWTR